MTNTEKETRYFGRDLEVMSVATNYYSWILHEFRSFIGNTVLEVGAGCGNFSKFILTTNLRHLTVIEPSENMFPLLQKNLASYPNVALVKGTLNNLNPAFEKPFDTAIYVNVLEHIKDDRGELLGIFDRLSPGGHICIFVPALACLYGKADKNMGHERRYHQKPLSDLVETAGFVIVKNRYFDIVGIVPWWFLFRVLKRETVQPGQIVLYDKWVVPILRKIEDIVTPPIGKNILVVGRKPYPPLPLHTA